MFEIAWKEFTKSGRIVIKSKSFDNEVKMNIFIERLFGKENFYEMIAYR